MLLLYGVVYRLSVDLLLSFLSYYICLVLHFITLHMYRIYKCVDAISYSFLFLTYVNYVPLFLDKVMRQRT